MQQRLGLAIAALLATAIVHFSSAVMAQGGRSEVKQIQLTEKQVQGVIAAQKDVSAILEKIQGPPPDELPPPIQAELEAAAKKHGFKDFNDYDEVAGNISLVMTGIDPQDQGIHRAGGRDQAGDCGRNRRQDAFPSRKRNKCSRS